MIDVPADRSCVVDDAILVLLRMFARGIVAVRILLLVTADTALPHGVNLEGFPTLDLASEPLHGPEGSTIWAE